MEHGNFTLLDKPKPELPDPRDAVVQVTLGSICTSSTDLCPRRFPEMYGKNLTFKTGGVDGCDCGKILSLIEQGKIDTTTHCYKLDGVIKVAVTP